MTNKQSILAVPTNIITGFLGVGKTSAIQHLLKQKPKDENWAILVNEFGEIGVDGSILEGQVSDDGLVFIEEVPGGCMCCASGVPMQIALNKLLKRAKPDRLLIEPTGLGHPLEVIELLSNEYYRDVLKLEKTITLVDARVISDSRYTEHQTFNQQIDIADLVVGNKTDLYGENDKQRLSEYLQGKNKSPDQLIYTEQGKLDIDCLSGAAQKTSHNAQHHNHSHHHHHEHHGTPEKQMASNLPLPATGILRANNQGEGFNSVGWRFAGDKVFNRTKLLSFLNNLEMLRGKGVFNTNEGAFGYNIAENNLEEFSLTAVTESRLEIIGLQLEDDWETALINTLQAK